MKVGMRKPSIKRSISARTTTRVNKSIKKNLNPMYGKKGMGYINDPSKAIYNKIYHKATVSTKDVLDSNTSNTRNNNVDPVSEHRSAGVGDVFKLIYYILVILWNIIKVIFFGAILIGIIYLVISIIF